jgi:gluconolactonase
MNGLCKVALGALLILVGCGSSSSEQSGGTGGAGGTGGSGGGARTCATDIAVGEVQAFGPETPTRTEGITFDADGNLFVSALYNDADDELLSIATDGSSQSVAQAASLLGLANSENGILAAGIDTGELLLIDTTDGSVEAIAQDLGAPNFVVTTPWGTILVSDDSQGENTIDEVTWEGQVSTWVQGVPTPNGMVFSLDGRTLYVASTFEEPGLWIVPVSENGEAGTPEKWVAFESTTPDGVAIDSEGNVYVALNFTNQIAKVDPEGNASIIAEGVEFAASLAFGQGEFDPCSIYVTSLFGRQLWRVGTGVLGTEN